MNEIFTDKFWLHIHKKYKLTPQELRVTILLCRKFSRGQALAGLINKNYGTFAYQLRTARTKLDVKTNIELVVKFATELVENFYQKRT